MDLQTGYRHPLYAASLAEFGKPRKLPCSGGWLLERVVPNFSDRDAIGCYPIFSASNWSGLSQDLANIDRALVSVALVADPFGDYLPNDLKKSFDRVVAFKNHYVVDFSKPLKVGRHHRYYSRRAAAQLVIEVGAPLEDFASDWSKLYESLVVRHGLAGIQAFSKRAFELQMRVPGMVVFRATESDSLVGAHLWYVSENVAYSHLAASTARGYELNSSYAIHSAVIEYFRSRTQWVDLGGGAGTTAHEDGLTRFKTGWSNSTRPVYFCGRVLNSERYNALSGKQSMGETNYFPAYRNGEFG